MISRNKDKIILVFKKTCAYKSHMLKFITKMLNLLLNTLSCRHNQLFQLLQRLQTININWPMNDFSKRKNKENEPTCTKTLSIYYLLKYIYFYLFILLQQYLFLFINGPRLIVYLYINAIKNLDGRFHPIQ